ncbi:MAG: hypothetical protein IKC32_06575 [Clostridia bacterium]|nr:hypothetical protein [Clostridia bacterium]
MKRSVALLLVILISSLALFSCAPLERGYLEVKLDLPDSFRTHDSGGTYDASYTDGRMIVGVLRLSFDAMENEGIPATMTPLRFAEYYKDHFVNSLDPTEVREEGDVPYLSYSSGDGFSYLATFYFSPYAYFVVTYVARDEYFEALKPIMLSYASLVTVDPYIIDRAE